MSAKATKPLPKLNRNPLSIALGAYLSAERQRISPDLKSGKLAGKLEIGESLYRMIESGNARIHPKNFLKFISVFEASNIEHGAFCRLLIAIQFLDSFLDSSIDFVSGVNQLQDNDERYAELLTSLKPLIEAVLKKQENLNDVFLTGKIVESIRDFLSQPDSIGKDTSQVQQEKIAGIFQEIPTIYYSFIDKMVQDLLTLPLGYKSADLWKWEKNNRSEFKYLFAFAKDIKAIISEDNFKRYKFEFLWSNNFIEAHIIFLGRHNVEKLHRDFCNYLKQSLDINHDKLILHAFDEGIKKLFIHSADLQDSEVTEILSDLDQNNPDTNTTYDLAWVFELQRKLLVGLKAKVINKEWKLQEGISLNWKKTATLYSQLRNIIITRNNEV